MTVWPTVQIDSTIKFQVYKPLEEYTRLDWEECIKEQVRVFKRRALIREELMAKCWHPKRVAQWLKEGYDMIDS